MKKSKSKIEYRKFSFKQLKQWHKETTKDCFKLVIETINEAREKGFDDTLILDGLKKRLKGLSK